MKTITKKTFLSVLTFVLMSCIAMTLIFAMNTGKTVKADEEPTLSATKFSVSTGENAGDYILLATPITGEVADIYEVGYTFTGTEPTFVQHETGKYYTSINGKGADELFGEPYTDETPMIVWEIENDAETVFNAQAYFKIGERDGGYLYPTEPEETIVSGTARNLKTYTITWQDKNGTTYKTERVDHGATVSQPANPAVVFGYAFDGWYVGESKYNFSTGITANTTIKQRYAAISPDDVYGAFSADTSLSASKFVDYGAYTVAVKDGDTTLVAGEDYTVSNNVISDIAAGNYTVEYTFTEQSNQTMDAVLTLGVLKDYTKTSQYVKPGWYGGATAEMVSAETVESTIGLPETLYFNENKPVLKLTNTGASNFGISILMPELFGNLDTLPDKAIVYIYMYVSKSNNASGIFRDTVMFSDGDLGAGKYSADAATLSQDAWTRIAFTVAEIKARLTASITGEVKNLTSFDRLVIPIQNYAAGDVVYMYGAEIDLTGTPRYGAYNSFDNIADASNSSYWLSKRGSYEIVSAATATSATGSLPTGTSFDSDKAVLKATPTSGNNLFGLQIRTNVFHDLDIYGDYDYISIWVYLPSGSNLNSLVVSDGMVSGSADGQNRSTLGYTGYTNKVNSTSVPYTMVGSSGWREIRIEVKALKDKMATIPLMHADRITFDIRNI